MSETIEPPADKAEEGHEEWGSRHRPKVHPNTRRRIRLAVYTRDGFRCLHCGWQPPVIPPDYDGDYALGAPDPTAGGKYGYRLLELDHVLPYSRGGLFTIDNLQTLCNCCNGRKGARV